jgi:hypothetical protein
LQSKFRSRKTDDGVRGVIAALVGAVVSFVLVASAVYYKMAVVRMNGVLHGGPDVLAAGMAGLFGGGIVAVVVLVILLRMASRMDRRIDG